MKNYNIPKITDRRVGSRYVKYCGYTMILDSPEEREAPRKIIRRVPQKFIKIKDECIN